MKIKELIKRIKGIKNVEIIIAVVIAIIIILIYFLPDEPNSTNGNASISPSNCNNEQAKELASVLSKIKGAGNVSVMITYESNGELVPAYQQDINETNNINGNQVTYSRSESNKLITVYQQGGSGALILMEKKPQIKGVIVIAEGAADLNVKLNLYKAVQTVLQINATKVDVFEMK